MNRLPARFALLIFTVFCLGFGLMLPAHPVLAGQAVTIDSAVPAGNVYGNGPGPNGSSFMPFFPPGDLLDPNNNTVNIISGGMVNADVYGGWSDAPGTGATGNSVTISGNAQVVGDVHGGYSTFGSVTGNSVTIRGGTVNGQVVGGRSNGDSATGNSVTISGGTVNSDVVGGKTDINGGNATGNTVTITGGTVNGNVFGGWADSGGSNATGNTVTISGSPTFNPLGTNLQGGKSAVDQFTGNTLNVWNYTGSAVSNVTGFENFNFILPVSLQGLEVTNFVSFGDGLGNFSKVTGVSIMGGGSAPQPGQNISLIQAGSFTGTIANNGAILAGKKGALLDILFRLDQQANDLFAVVEGVKAAPEAKALSEGFLSGVALLNQGADLVAGKGMNNAVDSARQISKAGASTGYGLGVFGALSGGWSRYNTGSHVDVSGLSLIAGLSFGADLPPGRLTLGAFFEYGTGSYDTYNSFATDYHGKGNIYHLGGGVLGRMDFVDTGPGNFYAEASFRAGGLHNDYRNSDLRDLNGRRADYDSFSPYYGIHAGLGYIWKFTEQASLDLYGKYFWTRQQGDSVTLKTGDPVKFKDTDSHRLRLGGRFSYAVNDYLAPYIGAAWEYEMDGRQRASTYGYAIDTPTLHGSTGIGELGLTVKPSKELPLSFDLGVQGYVGKREGVTGSMQIRWEF